MLTKKTAERLISLANRYETPLFLEKDPSQFMHRFKAISDQEIVAFLSAVMAFGQRKQILSHVETVLKAMENHPTEWVQNKGYRNLFTEGDRSFYRMYTHNDFLLFFDTLHRFLEESGTIGKYFMELYSLKQPEINENFHLTSLICTQFDKNCHLIPQSKGTAAKRINMFLRWMVRDNSPVDLGLWSSWYEKGNLLIPLDTHVMQESAAMGLFELSASGNVPSANIKTCLQLTKLMDTVFPGDPCRADYALFGLGVDKQQNS